MAAISIGRNGYSQDAPQIGKDVIKILVVGDAKCGKSTFIRTFCEYDLSDPVFVDHGAIVYRYDYFRDGELKKYAFLDIPGVHNAQVVLLHHGDASGCIFMYAVDEPSTFDHLDHWITKVGMCSTLPMMKKIVVGSRNDLRANPHVIERLALENRTPITVQQGRDFTEHHQLDSFFECSMYNYTGVNNAFCFILNNTSLT